MSSTELQHYYGDLHSHCEVGYGHGTIEEALANARQQLDFVAVTPHAHWHDMPVDDPRLTALVAYHRRGFKATANLWDHYSRQTEKYHEPGRFVTFPAFEWHSCRYGDHNVYFRDGKGEIIRASDLPDLRQSLRQLAADGRPAMAIPHHIGYRAGFRGIAWEHFDPEFSPVVEALSMHGAAEHTEGPRPYLHTMGPRTRTSSYQYGLQQGHVVGLIGSTDHHSAHPGSYGHGRLGVLAPELTREAIWDAIWARRTYALTGANIRLDFAVDNGHMGDVITAGPDRRLHIAVEGSAAIDTVEILHNNRLIERAAPLRRGHRRGVEKIEVTVGWGERGTNVDWEVALQVRGGRLVAVEPRFRGDEIVAPDDNRDGDLAFSSWSRCDSGVSFNTRTWGNPTTTTPSTQGVCLSIEGDDATRIEAVANGREISMLLGTLREGPESSYLSGFLSPVVNFGRAVPAGEYHYKVDIDHRSEGDGRDWYHARVHQVDGQAAWSSPIWVDPA